MRVSSRIFAALALATILTPRAASAGSPSDPTGAPTVELVHGFWTLVSDVRGQPGAPDDRQQPKPAPQAIAPARAGDPPVSLNDLSRPTAVESQLRAALRHG